MSVKMFYKACLWICTLQIFQVAAGNSQVLSTGAIIGLIGAVLFFIAAIIIAILVILKLRWRHLKRKQRKKVKTRILHQSPSSSKITDSVERLPEIPEEDESIRQSTLSVRDECNVIVQPIQPGVNKIEKNDGEDENIRQATVSVRDESNVKGQPIQSEDNNIEQTDENCSVTGDIGDAEEKPDTVTSITVTTENNIEFETDDVKKNAHNEDNRVESDEDFVAKIQINDGQEHNENNESAEILVTRVLINENVMRKDVPHLNSTENIFSEYDAAMSYKSESVGLSKSEGNLDVNFINGSRKQIKPKTYDFTQDDSGLYLKTESKLEAADGGNKTAHSEDNGKESKEDIVKTIKVNDGQEHNENNESSEILATRVLVNENIKRKDDPHLNSTDNIFSEYDSAMSYKSESAGMSKSEGNLDVNSINGSRKQIKPKTYEFTQDDSDLYLKTESKLETEKRDLVNSRSNKSEGNIIDALKSKTLNRNSSLISRITSKSFEWNFDYISPYSMSEKQKQEMLERKVRMHKRRKQVIKQKREENEIRRQENMLAFEKWKQQKNDKTHRPSEKVDVNSIDYISPYSMSEKQKQESLERKVIMQKRRMQLINQKREENEKRRTENMLAFEKWKQQKNNITYRSSEKVDITSIDFEKLKRLQYWYP